MNVKKVGWPWNPKVWGTAWFLLGAFLAAGLTAYGQSPSADRSEPSEMERTGETVSGKPDESEPEIHPDAVSSFQTRLYKMGLEELWKDLLEILEREGYPPEEVDEKEHRVKTSFVDYKSIDFREEPTDFAPRLSPNYFIMQMRHPKTGKVSLEAVVAPDKRGTSVSLRARILVQGLDRSKSVIVMTDRRSSGIIEADFFRKLEDRLELERI